MFSKVDSTKVKTAQIEMLRTSMEAYRLDMGDYPNALSELRSPRVLDGMDLTYQNRCRKIPGEMITSIKSRGRWCCIHSCLSARMAGKAGLTMLQTFVTRSSHCEWAKTSDRARRRQT